MVLYQRPFLNKVVNKRKKDFVTSILILILRNFPEQFFINTCEQLPFSRKPVESEKVNVISETIFRRWLSNLHYLHKVFYKNAGASDFLHRFVNAFREIYLRIIDTEFDTDLRAQLKHTKAQSPSSFELINVKRKDQAEGNKSFDFEKFTFL